MKSLGLSQTLELSKECLDVALCSGLGDIVGDQSKVGLVDLRGLFQLK